MAQQKRDPETGKFISRSDYFAKYPQGLTAEQYQKIQEEAKIRHERVLEVKEKLNKETESADHLADENPEAIPSSDKPTDLYGEMYHAEDFGFSTTGCIAALVVMIMFCSSVVYALFAIFGD